MGKEISVDRLPIKGGRPPTLASFVRTINRFGIHSIEARGIAQRLSYFQVAALRGHTEFQSLLDGIVLKALIEGREIDESERWALKFLRDGSARSFQPKRGYNSEDDSPEIQRMQRQPILIRPEQQSA